MGFLCGSDSKEFACNAGDLGLILGWVGKSPWKREQLLTPVFWPGEFHGLYSPCGLKELDTTEQLWASLIAQLVENLPAMQGPQFDSWVGKIPWRRDRLPTPVFLGFPGGSAGKESACNVGDLGSTPG